MKWENNDAADYWLSRQILRWFLLGGLSLLVYMRNKAISPGMLRKSSAPLDSVEVVVSVGFFFFALRNQTTQNLLKTRLWAKKQNWPAKLVLDLWLHRTLFDEFLRFASDFPLWKKGENAPQEELKRDSLLSVFDNFKQLVFPFQSENNSSARVVKTATRRGLRFHSKSSIDVTIDKILATEIKIILTHCIYSFEQALGYPERSTRFSVREEKRRHRTSLRCLVISARMSLTCWTRSK